MAAENVGPWLREYEGYRGTFVFVDAEDGDVAPHHAMEDVRGRGASASSRGAMRDQLAATAGMEVVAFEVFEVLAHELIPDADGDRSS